MVGCGLLALGGLALEYYHNDLMSWLNDKGVISDERLNSDRYWQNQIAESQAQFEANNIKFWGPILGSVMNVIASSPPSAMH
jgi:hypothetical protein